MKSFLIEIDFDQNTFFKIIAGEETNFNKVIDDLYQTVYLSKNINYKDLTSHIKKPAIVSLSFLDDQKVNDGFVIIVKKLCNTITIYNDIFGYNRVFYKKDNKKILVSNSYSLLNDNKQSIAPYAILDLVLFHYLVGGSTPSNIIKKLKGGNKLLINKNECVEVPTKPILDFFKDRFEPHVHTLKNTREILQNEITSKLDNNKTTYLTLTGGFDSRTLLSVLLQSRIPFETITWGGKGNLQNNVSQEISSSFGIKHKDIYLSDDFIKEIFLYSQNIIEINPENPMILDMPQYLYMSKNIPESNIITGFMGSEIIRGPSVSSQTTLTQVAAKLALCNSLDEFYNFTSKFLDRLNLFNKEYINQILPEYIEKFYYHFTQASSTHKRALEFLFYEKYVGFFKNAVQLHKPHNLINPYMNLDFITTILNQKTSILNYPVFNTSSKDHFDFYKVYAQIIKSAYPKMLNTRVDRGYKIKHLTNFYDYPFLAYYHLKNHILRRSKVKYSKPLDYPLWMKQMILDNLQNSNSLNSDLFNLESINVILDKYSSGLLNDELMQKKLIILAGINLYNNSISN
ncbi:MAG: hypothetical protein RBR71_13540 [Gudongella sp.]|jgi:hypothetical protein|nr:hypothetical protein [Bacteroidales bacterium]MDY0237043.1 hypothetical protein [Gudongella sp.]